MAFTFFFRDLHTLELIITHLLPAVAGRLNVRLWDAGCAMGQEAYSLAILLAEKMGYFAYNNLRIDATDLDEQDQFGSIVQQGEYQEEEIKRIPAEILAKYFGSGSQPGYARIAESVRNRIRFQKHDLLSLTPPGEGYSLVLCKNVLLHFQPEQREEVIRMFHRSLAPEGLFATEQTQKMPAALAGLFTPVVQDAQLFRKVEA